MPNYVPCGTSTSFCSFGAYLLVSSVRSKTRKRGFAPLAPVMLVMHAARDVAPLAQCWLMPRATRRMVGAGHPTTIYPLQ
jgi:hypothetical protein